MQINYEQVRVLTSLPSLVLHYLYKYLHISAPSSFYPPLYPVSHLTSFPSCHPQFLIALHWLSLSRFFCVPSKDPEHIHMSLEFNTYLAFTFYCISISSIPVCALPSTHLKTSILGCSPFTYILQYFPSHSLSLHPEGEGSSETPLNLYQITRCYIPDESIFSQFCENYKMNPVFALSLYA